MIKPISLAFMSILILGCAAPPQKEKASAGLKSGVMQGYVNCLTPYIERLDDGISDARTVAEAMPKTCNADFDAVSATWGQGGDPEVERIFHARQREFQDKLVLSIILSSRASKAKSIQR